MKAFHALRRSLAQRLDRLRDALQTLRDQLRVSVARLVGEGVGDAVREVLRDVLAASPNSNLPAFPVERACRPRPPFWGEPDEALDEMGADDLFDDDPRDTGRFDFQRAQQDRFNADDDKYAPEPADEPRADTPLLLDAVAAGSQAASWWSRRRPDWPRWTAVTIGLVAGLTAYGSGLLPGVAGVAVTVIGLLSQA